MQTSINFENLENIESTEKEVSLYIRESLKGWVGYFNQSSLNFLSLILHHIENCRHVSTVYPSKENTLKIYKDLDLKDIKVVILGQDPYYNGNANGYAFGCKESISSSLGQIYNSISKQYPHNPNLLKDKELSYLVKQGVFLLNSILTVEKDKPYSHHRKGWQNFIKDTVKLINNNRDFIVWMLWGKIAQEYKIYIDNPTHLVLTHTHPSYASRNKIDWDCNHFKLCNNYLESAHKEPIQWR